MGQDGKDKKRKRKAKAKAKAKTGGEAGEAIEALTADGRATLVIDDIINAVPCHNLGWGLLVLKASDQQHHAGSSWSMKKFGISSF